MNYYYKIKNLSRRILLPVKFFFLLIALTLSFSSGILGQDMEPENDNKLTVKGKVIEAHSKNAMAAVQVRTLNHQAAATTDENGQFSIEISSSNEVLLITAYDYYPLEVSVRGREDLVIEMYPDFFKEMYPLVQGLTGQLRSSLAANSISGITDLDKNTALSVDKLINSRLGGSARSISNSGEAGRGSTIFLRGLNSINLNAQPLFVVDGVPWNDYSDVVSLHDGFLTNFLADIDLTDIENVTVIKDGASIYGSKGGNGVILVNTKRGRDMATKIEANAVGGILEMPGSIPLMNGDQFRIYLTDLIGTRDISFAEIDAMEFLQDDPSKLSYKTYHNTTNWNKEIYRQGISQGYNIIVNGGDEKALYNFSMGYTGIKGVVKSTDLQRLNTRFNSDFTMNDKITAGLSVGFTNVDRTLLDDGVNFYTSPTYLAMIKAPFLNPYSYTNTGDLTSDTEDSDDFNVGNPLAIIEKALNTNKHYRLNLGIRPKYRISPSLTLSSLFDYNLDKVKETYYSPIVGVADRYIPGLGISENVFRSQQMRNTGVFVDNRFEYTHQFGDVHRINAIAGWRYLSNYYEGDFAEGHNSGSDQKRNLLSEEDFKLAYGLNNKTKSVSNYVNVDYSYDHRYYATASLSMDASSRFGQDTRGGFQLFNRSWGLFPSLNAGWLISSEDFMTGISFIDLLKLRAGYSISGNDGVDPYAWTAYFNSIRYMDRANGLVLGNIANEGIQWESSKKLNFGIDANVLNNRLAVSADIYSNRTSDLIILRSLPDITGLGYYWDNSGELSNKGYELSGQLKILNLNLLKWELSTSIGHYKNRIETLPDGDFTTELYGGEILTSVGNPAGIFYGYKTKGVFASQADADAAQLKMTDENGLEHYFGAGDIHFDDFTADGIINEKDKQVIGDPNPDFYGSFSSNMLLWKFTLEAVFTFSYGNEIYNYLQSQLESGSDYINQTTAVLNRWTYEGLETFQPRAVYGDPMGNARFSDRWIEDGSYLRLKSLSINYKIPVRSKTIEEINIWASANNLWTFTNYLGRDPEVSAQRAVLYQGIDTGLIPAYRSYFIGIKLNL